MKKTCLGFPLWKARANHRIAKANFRGIYVPGLNHFKLKDYDKLGFKVGDLAHDCDGFNHKIGKIVPEYFDLTTVGFKRGKILINIDFYKDDGTAFCHATAPLPREHIFAWWEAVKANRGDDQWGFADRYEELYGKDFVINEDGTVNSCHPPTGN